VDVLTFSDARARLKSVMDRVTQDGEEIVVARRGGESVVIVSLESWNSVQETLHLLSTPANAEALRRSIAQLDAGEGTERDPVTP
jgi:antitoxin YefM